MQVVEQLEAHAEVQSEQPSFVQPERMGKTPDRDRKPNTGKAFFAASLKNSLLFLSSLVLIMLVITFLLWNRCKGIILHVFINIKKVNSNYVFVKSIYCGWGKSTWLVVTFAKKCLFMNKGVSIILLFSLMVLIACQKKQEGKIAVTTNDVTDITESSAKGGGSVSFTGSYTIEECGICYDDSPQPTVRKFYTEDSYGEGSFTSVLNNLEAGTKYYVRAYARTSSGIEYGNQKSFTTLEVGGDGEGVPIVTTKVPSSISQNKATCGGKVTDDGGSTVTERGVCWDTDPNPVIDDSYLTASSGGTGSFTVKITDLDPNTTYHVRAYARNSNGISYGEDVAFTTDYGKPEVTSSAPILVTYSSVELGGDVTSDGGSPVTERGIYWGVKTNPVVFGSCALADSEGSGSFTVSIGDLGPGTTYYYCAYAKNRKGTVYGEERSFTTESSASTTGDIKALYSVSPSSKVYFSKGNLQFFAYSKKWRFAEHQYDYIRYSNEHISYDYAGWIDLFGWGTSGTNHGAVCYQPWSTSTTDADYYAYGQFEYNLNDQDGHADWGCNPISNGGNVPNRWRTLTIEEWRYVLNTRNTPSSMRFAKATVNDVCGLILLPDNWSSNNYNLNKVNIEDARFNSNEITALQWDELERSGAVFLPAGGYRYNATFVSFVDGWYWSASSDDSDHAYDLHFNYYNISTYSGSRSTGKSVRLVYPAD